MHHPRYPFPHPVHSNSISGSTPFKKKPRSAMKTWDLLHRGVLVGMGALTAIATYRSVEEYRKRAAAQEARDRKKAEAFAKAMAAEAARATAEEASEEAQRKSRPRDKVW